MGLAFGHVPQPQRDRDRHHELGPRAQAERAALDELRVVVGEAQQRARDRGAEHPHRAPFVVGEDQERDRDGEEDDDAAHRRRPGLLMVALGAVLADVLAELALAQELDELRAQEDADEQRGGAPEQNPPHQRRPGRRLRGAPAPRRQALRRPARGRRRASPSRGPCRAHAAACRAARRPPPRRARSGPRPRTPPASRPPAGPR